MRFGGTITVNEGETVDGDVVVIGGFARVMGRVNGEVVVVGGSAELGPKADVTGDVVVVGGGLKRDPGARIGGEVEEVGVGPDQHQPRHRAGRAGAGAAGPWFGNPFGGFFSLISTVVRVGILCLLTAIVLLLGGGYVDRIRTLAAAEPLKAGAVGFLSQVLMVPLLVILTIVLIITIVGIPFLLLLPFAVLALAVLALVGFTAVAREVGQKVLGRVWSDNGAGVFAATMAGVLLIVSPVLLGRLVGMGGGPLWLVSTPLSIVGFVVEYLAWTIGFGAVLFMLFGRRTGFMHHRDAAAVTVGRRRGVRQPEGTRPKAQGSKADSVPLSERALAVRRSDRRSSERGSSLGVPQAPVLRPIARHFPRPTTRRASGPCGACVPRPVSACTSS